MAEQENVQVVQKMYEDFQRGDMPAVLNVFTEDIEMLFPGPRDIPYSGPWHGRDKAAELFKLMGDRIEVQHFEMQEFLPQGEKVVAFGHERTLVKSTGRTFDVDLVHVWDCARG